MSGLCTSAYFGWISTGNMPCAGHMEDGCRHIGPSPGDSNQIKRCDPCILGWLWDGELINRGQYD